MAAFLPQFPLVCFRVVTSPTLKENHVFCRQTLPHMLLLSTWSAKMTSCLEKECVALGNRLPTGNQPSWSRVKAGLLQDQMCSLSPLMCSNGPLLKLGVVLADPVPSLVWKVMFWR